MRFRPLLAALVFAAPLAAQLPPDATLQPQVNPDRTVTFHYTAPGVMSAAVALDAFKNPVPMHKDEAGVWTLTTEPMTPEYYSYHFVVDGNDQLDPRNVTIKASYTSVGNGFLVPGTPAETWETTAVPHGTVHHHTFTTHVVEGLDASQDEFYVYTPPGYDARAKAKYPVLYLLHGWSDTAAGWSVIGHANDILDNLIATGKAKPMIVVMPLGYGQMSFVRSGHGVWDDPVKIQGNVDLFQKSLLSEVLPEVEQTYRVAPGRENRAIAGLSMGGLEALSVGLENTKMFAWVGGYSAAVHKFDPATVTVDPKTANLRLLWIACGTSDSLIEPNRRLSAALKARGLPVTQVETPGAHTWLVWRDNMNHFIPLLFQPK